MEDKGIVGTFEGSKPRPILISRQQWLEMTMNNQNDATLINTNEKSDEAEETNEFNEVIDSEE